MSLTVYKNRDTYIKGAVVDNAGAVVDVSTLDDIVFRVARKATSASNVIKKSVLGTDIEIGGGLAANEYLVTLSPADVADMRNEYYFDVETVEAGESSQATVGTLNIAPALAG